MSAPPRPTTIVAQSSQSDERERPATARRVARDVVFAGETSGAARSKRSADAQGRKVGLVFGVSGSSASASSGSLSPWT